MEVTKTAAIAGMEISEIESRIDEKQLKQLMEKIRRAKKIYVCGAGRSLLMLRCFAMRLMHVGYDAVSYTHLDVYKRQSGRLFVCM